MAEQVFQPLPTVPDHPALEEEILGRWEAEGTFQKLREQSADRAERIGLRTGQC